MSIEIDVWAEHKINLGSAAEAVDAFESAVETKIIQRNFSEKLEPTLRINEIQYFTDSERLESNFKNFQRIELMTNFAFCQQIKIYAKTVNFRGSGFYTRDSRRMELITGDFADEAHWNPKLAAEFTNNWRQFRNYCKEITRKLNGEKIVYIRDNSRMLDKFLAGESLQNAVEHELAVGVSEYYDFALVENFPDDFKNKYVWFFEDLPPKDTV